MSDMSGSGPLRIHHVESLETPEASARIFQVTGFVKWFDVARGYGFIIPDNGAADVLLHLSCLKRDGYRCAARGHAGHLRGGRAPEGHAVPAGTGGRHVDGHPPGGARQPHACDSHRDERLGAVQGKMVQSRPRLRLRHRRATASRTSSSTWRRCGKTAIPELLPDQWVYVRFGDGPKGKMAAEVRLTLDSGGPGYTH